MIQPYSREYLAEMVIVSASEPFTGAWDGMEYDLSSPVSIKRGVAFHWRDTNPNITFEISNEPNVERDPKDVVNPLEANDRGEAFEGLKRRGRPTAKGA